ncbi:helix-turn-helix domain-containing protein [Paramaledivibacter caminithermalis]|uniref:Helix-turn-helix domain-containing protein n=1 Tax=Paramaledivibacter caminithermalis (strain DSM 15212 / CIP 107654 / DViRD3) TaxID=1121301 RepID=A0A1M6UBT0_PARC5|nr:helix-turn-helix transcriptional regulator [Paramaledivibacter caminithermalis]SHK66705.1 Helix-turn-helix domain-containing protein [Paramaledivibacter caminithermalis DSM 15212]
MLGDKIKEYRSIKGLTQKQLAVKINKSPTLITKIETNNANPSLQTLECIARALEVPLINLLEDQSA